MQLLFTSPRFLRAEVLFKLPANADTDASGNTEDFEEVGYVFSLARSSRPAIADEWGQTSSAMQYTAYTQARIDPRIVAGAIADGLLDGRPITLKVLGINPPGTIAVSSIIGESLLVEISSRSILQ